MTALHDKAFDVSTPRSQPGTGSAARRSVGQLPSENWDRRSERWGRLMAAEKAGERHVYEQLLRELDVWLRCYYARRLPPPAAEDARQEALMAIHANRHRYTPSRPFGAWVTAIARYKWIDRVRVMYRWRTTQLDDAHHAQDDESGVVSTIALDQLLATLKPPQAEAIRLVKLQGFSIEEAASRTGQSVSLVKVNIHRGLAKLTLAVQKQAHIDG